MYQIRITPAGCDVENSNKVYDCCLRASLIVPLVPEEVSEETPAVLKTEPEKEESGLSALNIALLVFGGATILGGSVLAYKHINTAKVPIDDDVDGDVPYDYAT